MHALGVIELAWHGPTQVTKLTLFFFFFFAAGEGIETTPNEVYHGVSIETTPSEVYGVNIDGIEITPNAVYEFIQ